LLKTAEELKVKGLAEVSWRAEEAQAAANAMADEAAAHLRDDEEPAYKRMRRSVPPPTRPSHTPPTQQQQQQQFKPRVTSITGAAGTKDAYVLKKSVASPYVDISMASIVCGKITPYCHDSIEKSNFLSVEITTKK
jgi:hypothetical protein